MIVVAVEQHEPAQRRIVDDDLVTRLLPAAARATVRACRWAPLRALLVGATERRARGLWAGMLCRKRYAADQLTAAIDAGLGQLVVLGAGLDTCASRLAAPRGVRSFEVDLPANIEAKRRLLRSTFGRVPDGVELVPVDFGRDDLAARLTAHGYDPGTRSFFLWEGVTQYLAEPAVRATLAVLSTAPVGSTLAFTYVRADFLSGVATDGAQALYRDFVTHRPPLWTFGLDPDAVAGLLAGYGWVEREQVGSAEYAAHYLRPAGRDLPVSDLERFVIAERVDAST